MELKYHKFKLKNGVRVIMVPRKETKAVFVEVIFGAGSRYEDRENNGIAHFLEHMAFKGTKKRPTTLDISKEIDQVGGSYNAYTGEDITGYWFSLQSEKIELALDILSDMVINSKIEEKELKKESCTILEEIKMHNDRPESFSAIKFQELLYGDTPLGRNILGTTDTVKAINRKKMLEFSEKFYTPDNMVIAIGGNINQKKTRELIEKYFGGIKGKKQGDFEKNCIIQDSPRIKIHHSHNEQAKVIMGFRSFGRSHKDRYVRNILTKVLGGYMSSRLFIELREKKGLAYDVYSWSDSYLEVGVLGISGGFSPAKTSDAITEIFRIIRDIKKNGCKPSEIKMAKENSIGKMILSVEGSGGWASGLASNLLYGLPLEMPEEMIAKTKKVSNADIKRVAKEIFRPENLNMVIVGPIDAKEEAKYLKLIKL